MAKLVKKPVKRAPKEKSAMTPRISESEELQDKVDSLLFTTQFFKWFGTMLGSQPLTAIVGLLAAGSIIACISYALGYIFTVDFRLVSLFSLQDVISIGLPAVPLIAMFFIFGLAVMPLVTGMFKDLAPARPPRSPESFPIIRQPKEESSARPSLGFPIFAVCLVAFIVFFGNRTMGLFLGIVYALIIVFERLMSKRRSLPASFALFVAILIFVFFPFALFGAFNAERDLESSRRNYHIVLQGESQDVLLMAANTDILLVRDDLRTVRIIPRRLVTEITVFEIGDVHPWFSIPQIWKKLFSEEVQINTHGR